MWRGCGFAGAPAYLSLYTYVLSGNLRVTNTKTGRRNAYKAGDFIVESVGQMARGANIGDELLKLLVINIVEKGRSSTVLRRQSPGTVDPVSILRDMRNSIDNINAAIIHMLAERFPCTRAVGELKAQHGLRWTRERSRAFTRYATVRFRAAIAGRGRLAAA